MFSGIQGYGSEHSEQYIYHGEQFFEQIYSKTKAEVVVKDELVERLIELIGQRNSTGTDRGRPYLCLSGGGGGENPYRRKEAFPLSESVQRCPAGGLPGQNNTAPHRAAPYGKIQQDSRGSLKASGLQARRLHKF